MFVCLLACLCFFPGGVKEAGLSGGINVARVSAQLTTQDFELSHFLGCIS